VSELRKRLTYANVTSTLALFIALTGAGAYAAGQIADKSVGARQLRPGAVTADKIRKNAVTAPKIEALAVKQGKIANGAVTGKKIANGVITGEKLATAVITSDKIADNSVTGAKVDEESLGQVPAANKANTAGFAETANPEAFAKVDQEGTVLPASSKGIGTVDVKQGKEAGIYCINIPGFAPRGAQATPEYSTHTNVNVFIKFGGTESCAAPKIEVRTYSAGSLQKEPFYFMAYR